MGFNGLASLNRFSQHFSGGFRHADAERGIPKSVHIRLHGLIEFVRLGRVVFFSVSKNMPGAHGCLCFIRSSSFIGWINVLAYSAIPV